MYPAALTYTLLASDWLFRGIHVARWMPMLAAIALIAALVAWLEARPQASILGRRAR
jgi:hypothetical protein